MQETDNSWYKWGTHYRKKELFFFTAYMVWHIYHFRITIYLSVQVESLIYLPYLANICATLNLEFATYNLKIMLKLGSVSTLQGKIFLFDQINFMYVWTKLKQYLSHQNKFSTNTYFVIILKSCWYNLYINPADLFNDIFLICKVRWMETWL